MKLTEEELVYNYRLGREEALNFLFYIYEIKVTPFFKQFDYVFRLNGYDYEDKKGFVRKCLYAAVNGVRFKEGNLNSYYSTIAYREIVSLYRERKGTVEEELYYSNVSLSDVEVADNSNENYESGDRLDLGTVLNKIKQIGETEYRIMIYYLEGNTYAQIGEKMNMKPKSVSNYIQKIRFKLRNN